MNFRISEAGQRWIDEVANEYQLSRTSVILAALTVARENPVYLDAQLAKRANSIRRSDD